MSQQKVVAQQMSLRKQVMAKSKTLFQAEKAILDQEKNSDQLASWEEAVAYRNKFSVMKNNGDSYEQYSLNCDLSELAQYGPGLRLFFELVKYSAIVFFLMSLISIPALIGNIQGQSLNSIEMSTNSLPKLSISNQPQLKLVSHGANSSNAQYQADYTENQQRIASFVNNSDSRLLQVAIPDIVYSVIFLLFVFWFHYHSYQIAKETDLKNSLPSNYSIEVSGFPQTIIDEKILSNHFRDNFSVEVFECKFARNYYNTLFLHKEEAKLIGQIKQEKSRQQFLGKDEKKSNKLQKLGQKLADIQADINKQIQTKMNGQVLSHNEYPSVKAFVIFNNIEDKQKIQKEYQKTKGFFGQKRVKEFMLQNKHLLKINFKPDEPSNILWENLEVSSFNRFLRTLVVIILVIIVMIITFAVIIIANIATPQNSDDCPQQTISFSDASKSSLYTQCYCTSVSFSQMTSDSSLQNLCWDVWVKYATTYALTIVTGLVVLIVNFLLRLTIQALGKFNRYKTITKYTTSMTSKLFLAFFVNTALITLFLQANIYGFVPAITFSKPIPAISNLQDNNKSQFATDFDRSWYLQVGSKITVTVFFFVVTLFLFQFLYSMISKCMRESKVKKLEGKDVQRVANQKILGPEFQISFYYASTFNIIFTTLFYSSGIPIMLFAGFIILTSQYWVYKYLLLRACRRPPTYDTGLNRRMLMILPWSLILHLAVGLYMYGQPLIFPSSQSQLILNMNQTTGELQVKINDSAPIENRAFHVLYLFIFLLIVLGVYILNISYSGFLQRFVRTCFSKSHQVVPQNQQVPYNEEYHNIEKRMLPSYNIKINQYYRYIIQAIDLEKKFDSENSPRANNSSPYNKDTDSINKNIDSIIENI
ncbi:hypothetical protein ABPG72_010185 [Tetrahymena utriculariae]